SEVLKVISSSPGELQPVFEAMLANATHICEATFGWSGWHSAENRPILGGMCTLCRLIFGLVVDLCRSRAALEAEVLVLKQQIIVLRRGKPNRMPFLAVDRFVLGGGG